MFATMTPDLWALAAITFLSCLSVLALGVAERQRSDPRPHRHRRRLSKSEIAMEAREIIYGLGYICLGLYAVGIAGFRFVVAGLHRLDEWRMRRFWGGQQVHS